MSSASEEGYTLNKSGHFALLGKVHNDEIFKESDLNLRISTLNEKERGRRIRKAIKPEELKQKQREDVIGSGSNNWFLQLMSTVNTWFQKLLKLVVKSQSLQ